MNNKSTLLFYDTETTGLNPAFDQILRFACIRTDMNLEEISRKEIHVKLRNDIIPGIGAMLITRISIENMMDGYLEYDAAVELHEIFNEPNTISIGYNSLSFDEEFLRHTFYRNLKDPYTHQYANGCKRIDLLPITAYYYLFSKKAIVWPEHLDSGILRLENLGIANNLAEGMCHDAMVDVEATLELAKRLKHHDEQLWQHLYEGFQKEVDRLRINSLRYESINVDGLATGMLIGHKIGYNNNCIAPIIEMGTNNEHNNQTSWLRLDKYDFEQIHSKEDFGKLYRCTVRRKVGQPDFIVPIDEKSRAFLNQDRIMLMENNLKWIEKNMRLFNEYIHHRTGREYEERPDIDVDAQLYSGGFFSNQEVFERDAFHQITPENKSSFIEKIYTTRLRELSIRILGRNFPELLSSDQAKEYENYLKTSQQKKDIRGNEPTNLLEFIHYFNEVEPPSEDKEIVNGLVEFIEKKKGIPVAG